MTDERKIIRSHDAKRPRATKSTEPFDVAKSLRNIATAKRMIAAEYEKLADAGVLNQLERIGILCQSK